MRKKKNYSGREECLNRTEEGKVTLGWCCVRGGKEETYPYEGDVSRRKICFSKKGEWYYRRGGLVFQVEKG